MSPPSLKPLQPLLSLLPILGLLKDVSLKESGKQGLGASSEGWGLAASLEVTLPVLPKLLH